MNVANTKETPIQSANELYDKRVLLRAEDLDKAKTYEQPVAVVQTLSHYAVWNTVAGYVEDRDESGFSVSDHETTHRFSYGEVNLYKNGILPAGEMPTGYVLQLTPDELAQRENSLGLIESE
ncbi:hypothetical protein FJZ39_02830 [Candidatus Saccharibacteria bacterium]|nr:hypothetical protein [Candidatus Saccharibacteria bacterium]